MNRSRIKKKHKKINKPSGSCGHQSPLQTQPDNDVNDGASRYIEIGKSIALESSRAIKSGQCTFKEFLAKVDRLKVGRNL